MRSVSELLDSGGHLLGRYCSPGSRYAWPSYDLDSTPTTLVPMDVLSPAFLSYPIRRDYFERMLVSRPDGDAYTSLWAAMTNVVSMTRYGEDEFDKVDPLEISQPGGSSWGLVVSAFNATNARSDGRRLGLTSVAVSKILHRKRPHLIPLIDSRVRRFYDIRLGHDDSLLRALQADLILYRSELDELRSSYRLPGNREMTRLRALDILIWMSFESDHS